MRCQVSGRISACGGTAPVGKASPPVRGYKLTFGVRRHDNQFIIFPHGPCQVIDEKTHRNV